MSYRRQVALLGRALEHALAASGSALGSFEEAVEDLVLAPLGMGRSGFNYSDAPSVAEGGFMAEGADPATGLLVPLPAVSAPSPWWAPAGSMFATGRDMARFMAFLASSADPNAGGADGGSSAGSAPSSLLSTDGPAALDPTTAREMLLPGFPLRDGRSAISRGTYEQVFSRGHVLQTKAGCIGGFRSDVTLVPELGGLGVFAVLTSTCDVVGDGDALAFPIANRLIPAVEAALASEAVAAAAAKENTAKVAAASKAKANTTNDDDAALVGTYACPDGGSLAVTLEEFASGATSLVYRNYADYYPFALSFRAAGTDPLAPAFALRHYTMDMVGEFLDPGLPGCTSSAATGSVNTCPTTCPCRLARGDGEVASFRTAMAPAAGGGGGGGNATTATTVRIRGLKTEPCVKFA